ncbi:MAG: DUF1097 domain-containing protein [Gammaproteobacteria bacterium]|nr:DUF1097 domain-containing protein [Gammaproteobacteria bacterium]
MMIFTANYTMVTLVAAIAATLAATATAALGWPVWAMFIGWVAFFTGESTIKGSLATFGCLAIGIILGNFAATVVGLLMPSLGFLAFAPVVFVVAFIVVTLRAVSVLNNIPAYFLGLIAFFAAHIPPSLASVATLLAITALGSFAAYCTRYLQSRLMQRNNASTH